MPLPTTTHSRSRSSPAAGRRAARVDASHDQAEIVVGLAAFLAGVAGGDARRARPGVVKGRVDPARHRGAAVVGVRRWCQG